MIFPVAAPGPLRFLLIFLAVCYVIFLGACAAFQRRMIYFPTRMPEASAVATAKARGFVAWRNAAGELIGWQSLEPPGEQVEGVIVLFHGNGGQALDRTHYLEALRAWDARVPLRLYLFEYPGYGPVPGTPSEQAILESATDAVVRLRAQHPDSRLILAGESLGSGVVAALAGSETAPADGVILITPFDTLAAVGQRGMPFVPVGLLLLDRYDSVRNLAAYTGRVAVIAAGQDRVIPPDHARRLFESLNPDAAKRWWLEPQAGHNSLDYTGAWWREALEFVIGDRSERF